MDLENQGMTQGIGDEFSSAEIDAIGEILNISMGSAATAISTMLDKQVVITTPNVAVRKFASIDYSALEPAILIKIKYVEGISGSNVMLFRQNDMQIILNLLMGNDEPPSDEFVFDELSMSAACEVMNQMMGASATALSEFLGKTINISTPTTYMVDSEVTFHRAMEVDEEENVVSIGFNLDIDGVMNSDFVSVMTIELAKMIVNQAMSDQTFVEEPPAPIPAPVVSAPPPQAPAPVSQPPQPAMAPSVPAAPAPAAYAPPPAAPGGYPPVAVPGAPPQMPGYDPNMAAMYGMPPGYPYPPYYGGYPQYPPYPQQPQQAAASAVKQSPVHVQNAKMPDFTGHQPTFVQPLTSTNMDLIMNVPLNVTVEIGKTKRKIKDIMDFNQGTVIELEKQAGAPVDIVVNGKLIARGDVVVIDDNFGVRVTEIVGTRELIESMSGE